MQQEFVLGARSKQRLASCHPDLIEVVELAIQLTTVDFAVLETVRSEARQKRLFQRARSKTLNSRHLPKVPRNQPEIGRVSHAVDLGAWVNGAVDLDDWSHCFEIANSVKAAAGLLGVPIRWGGCWALLDQYENAEQAHSAYIERKKAAGKEPFPDGAHFELDWGAYPV